MEGLEAYPKIESILNGDGQNIREQMMLSGLFLMVFERLKDYVEHQVDSFFADDFYLVDGKLAYKRAKEFHDLIKNNGQGEPGQHTNKVFRAALAWFKEVNAISKENFDDIERLYDLRNKIGHELYLIVADDQKPCITVADVLLTFGLYVQISRWWIKEVEVSTNPDITPEMFEAADFDTADTLETALLRLIITKSLAGVHEYESLMELVQNYKPPDPVPNG